MNRLRIGTRGSRLARAQADWVAERIREKVDDVTVELVEIRTLGDLQTDRALRAEHGTAFFTKEIEDALLADQIDLAVHSCKDLATRLPEGLALAAIPDREDARDVLVSRCGTLHEMPAGASVATSSLRRKGFLGQVRPDLVLRDLRGNVPTRIRAVDEGKVDGVIVAAAGLIRLGMRERITEMLDQVVMVPAAGQGALALEVRADDERATRMAVLLDDDRARRAVEAERACLRRLEAGCQAPVGVFGSVAGSEITLDAAIVTPAGVTRGRRSAPAEDPEALGARVAADLLTALGLPSLREAAWAGPPPDLEASG